ncbi:MAG: PAS domain-containing protein [Nitratireductor sp.]|nr:PAS domain-containing protein [Nitratireductor sp.]MCB1459596.1 PAS domain-containing protein [Nitratireductor sp.]
MGSRLSETGRLALACFAMALVLSIHDPANTVVIVMGATAVFALFAILVPSVAERRDITANQAHRPLWPDSATKAMAEAFGHPVYILDPQGNVRYANQLSTQVFAAARVGDPLNFTFRQPEISRLLERSMHNRERAVTMYHERVPADRWFLVSVSPVLSQVTSGEPAFFMVSFIDQSEIKRAEEMRSDFIANASHELRTPLVSLRGFVETLQGPASSDPQATRQFLAIMLEQAERMSRLIDDLLSLSRIEMKAHLRPRDELDIREIVNLVRRTLENQAASLDVVVNADLPGQPAMILGDRDELVQVFSNLVENACKYGQSGGKVDIGVHVHKQAADGDGHGGDFVEVTVRDYGPGIAAEHLPRLTERFYRVDVADSRQKQGTGLGLAIVKHILARHGTRLVVNSTPGAGATFSVRFPALGERERGKSEKIDINQ